MMNVVHNMKYEGREPLTACNDGGTKVLIRTGRSWAHKHTGKGNACICSLNGTAPLAGFSRAPSSSGNRYRGQHLHSMLVVHMS